MHLPASVRRHVKNAAYKGAVSTANCARSMFRHRCGGRSEVLHIWGMVLHGKSDHASEIMCGVWTGIGAAVLCFWLVHGDYSSCSVNLPARPALFVKFRVTFTAAQQKIAP